MIAGPHVAAGMAIGVSGKKARFVIPAVLISHYILDAISHDLMLEKVDSVPCIWLKVTVLALDVLLAVAIVLFTIRRFPEKRTLLLAAAATALLPDALFHVFIWEPLAGRFIVADGVLFVHYAYHNYFGLKGFSGAIINQLLTVVIAVGWTLYCSRSSKSIHIRGVEQQ